VFIDHATRETDDGGAGESIRHHDRPGADGIPIVVNQLTMANQRRRGNAMVVLTKQDPTEVNEAVRSVVTDTRACRLVFRWGDPTRRSDLAMVGVEDARAIMVLSDEDARGDARVVKAVLAEGAELGAFDRIPIVAELTDSATAESLTRACGGQVFTIVASQAAASITAFSLAEPGLARVVEERLSFVGADIADDYVVSDAITSRLMTQLADQPERRAVVQELYGPTGSSIRLVGAAELELAGECEWNEIVGAAYTSGLLAIGWRLASAAGSAPVLNPDTSDRVYLTDTDRVVVIG